MTPEKVKEARQAIIQDSDLEANLKEFEDEAISMLEDMGLPTDRKKLKTELMKERPEPERIGPDPKALHSVLNSVEFVREHLSAGNIKNAVLETIRLCRAAARANLPFIIEGAKFSKGQSDKAKKPRNPVRDEKIRKDYAKAKKKNSDMITPSGWAKTHCKKYNLKWRRVTDILKA